MYGQRCPAFCLVYMDALHVQSFCFVFSAPHVADTDSDTVLGLVL